MISLRIQLLGNFRLEYCGDLIRAVDRARLQLLLAYLLLHHHAPQLRQQIAFQFWPDSSEPQARNNLRKALHELRQVWPDVDSFLHVDAQTIQWRPDASYSLDVTEFEELIAQAKALADHPTAQRVAAEAAVALYHGDLLPSGYDDWLIPERERLRQVFTETLESLVCLTEDQRDYAAAIHQANHLLRYAPLHEVTYRRLMRLHAVNGDRAAALQVYHTCVTTLQRELGVEPGEETQQAYAYLLEHEVPAMLRSQHGIRPSLPLRLVGRQREWHTLRAAWGNVTQGHAHFCLISGEAGIGKTRLAEELLAWTERQGIATAQTRSYAATGGLAYTPVIEWLRSEALQAALATLDDIWLTEIARLLSELLVERPTLPRPEPLADRWQRQRLFEALARGFLLDRRPKLLVIDDLQWCDTDTLEWLRYLLHFAQREAVREHPPVPLLVVGTARAEEIDHDHPLSALLLDLRSTGQVTELALGPLSAAESAELATQMTNTALDEAVAKQLYTQTEGNPLFIVETMRAGMGGWGETAEPPHNPQSLPSKVKAIIQYRLAQLSPTARELACLAATIGRSFTFDLLHAASEDEENEIVQSLDELWQRGIIRSQGGQAYDFSHDHIREVAYGAISPVQRPVLHRRVAQALERVYADDLDPVSAQLAAHYEQAAALTQAIAYYRQAGDRAHDLSVLAGAAFYYGHALTLTNRTQTTKTTTQNQLQLLAKLGWIQWMLGDNAEAQRLFAEGLALARSADDQEHLAEFARALGVIAWNAEEPAQGKQLLQSALAVQQQIGDRKGQARTLQNLGLVAEQQGEFADARKYYSDGLALARAVGERYDEGFALNNLAFLLGSGSDMQAAEQHCHDALHLADELGNQRMRATFVRNLGFIRFYQSRYEEAKRCFAESLEITSTIGMIAGSLETLVGMAYLADQAGQAAQALQLLGLVFHHPVEGHDIRVRAEPLLTQLQACLPAKLVAGHLTAGEQLKLDTVIQEILDHKETAAASG